MSERDLEEVTKWLLDTLNQRADLTPEDLIKRAEGRFSPTDVTWAIWYLKSEGRIRITRDDLVGAA